MGELGSQDQVIELQRQLVTARNEIKNLRQQVQSLKHSVRSDVTCIETSLQNFQCQNCIAKAQDIQPASQSSNEALFPPIGLISTWFTEKRGIPRQSRICRSSKGVINLNPNVINNPEYALEGLEEFSHMWIVYHFHKHDSNHVRSKVAPPRLNGARVGVFSTRSPHRPCPIGLSLVQIDKISGLKIYFSGVDMLDGTPVLDIKPYIPAYDDPTYLDRRQETLELEQERDAPVGEVNDIGDSVVSGDEREVEGGVSDDENTLNQSSIISLPTPNIATNQLSRDEALAEGREAPDGEEGQGSVRVANWISNPATAKLQVVFNDRASSQLHDNTLKTTIISVLREDPRSVYLRKKLVNQFYTFLIQDLHVSCKFNDSDNTVTVYQIKKVGSLCDCGQEDCSH